MFLNGISAVALGFVGLFLSSVDESSESSESSFGDFVVAAIGFAGCVLFASSDESSSEPSESLFFVIGGAAVVAAGTCCVLTKRFFDSNDESSSESSESLEFLWLILDIFAKVAETGGVFFAITFGESSDSESLSSLRCDVDAIVFVAASP